MSNKLNFFSHEPQHQSTIISISLQFGHLFSPFHLEIRNIHYLGCLPISRSIIFYFSASVVKYFVLVKPRPHQCFFFRHFESLSQGWYQIIGLIGHFVSRTTKIVVPRLSFRWSARPKWQIQDGEQQSRGEGILINGNTFKLRYPVFTSKYFCIMMSSISLCLAILENHFICHLNSQEPMVL